MSAPPAVAPSRPPAAPSGEVPFAPRPRRVRAGPPSLLDVAVDPTQRAAITLPAGKAMLILGEAGHGKTTVALHRLAQLWRESGGRRRGAVVVPTDGLARLLQPLLRRLGVDVLVATYDRWARAQAQRAFRRLPRESEGAPPSVLGLKRHPALRTALEELATRDPGRIDDDADAPARRTRALVSRGDLQHLFGDRVLLERVAESAKIAHLAVRDVLERTRVQLGKTTEEEWAHVDDRSRLVAVDGRALDEGTATAHANTIDAEDYAVLFELDRLRAMQRRLPPTAPRAFDLLVIDEAQEFAPLELRLLGRSLSPDGTLIVAGDADQQTDPTTTFPGWSSVMRELGQPHHATAHLEIGYRCPPDVVALARAVRDSSARQQQQTPTEESTTAFFVFESYRELLTSIGRGLRILLRRDRGASVAVVCRSPRVARRVASGLRAAVPTRIVWDGRFLARGPVQVSTVEEVKGLEFDFVIVPDANPHDYPDDAASRRAMYVAVTRARHQVVVACVGEPTRLLPWQPSSPQ